MLLHQCLSFVLSSVKYFVQRWIRRIFPVYKVMSAKMGSTVADARHCLFPPGCSKGEQNPMDPAVHAKVETGYEQPPPKVEICDHPQLNFQLESINAFHSETPMQTKQPVQQVSLCCCTPAPFFMPDRH
jgi:hypothetical protein